jgi:pimeloyl-ACP methyl ester carboxylesterase
MSRPLTPEEASILADSAYATLGSPTPALDAARQAGGSTSAFDVGGSSIFTGVTGFGVSSNFGYWAFGNTPQRQGECLVSIRGTNLISDWLTDARLSGASGPNGHLVHSGFSKLNQIILPQVKLALRNKNPSTIHIVGHSLGGAVATLLADALKDYTKLYLYTFGAPRAGSINHAAYLTHKLGAQNIYRVYHDTDPVPMVPIFPYGHCPAGSHGYLLEGTGMIISPGAHSMDLYKSNAKASWSSMQVMAHRRFSLDTVDGVLQQAGAIPGGYLSSLLMRLIVKALGMIMEAAGMTAGLALLGVATIADQLAYVMAKGVAMVGATAELLQNLIHQIMRFVGVTASRSVSFTVTFLKWLTEKLFGTIAMLARQAIRGF